jgi:hypothetical protein
MSTFMVIYIIMMLLGLRNGDIVQRAGETISYILVIFVALIVVFLALSRGGRKWTLWVSTGLGVLVVLAFIVGATQNPITIPVGITAAVGLLIAIFGVMALRESS